MTEDKENIKKEKIDDHAIDSDGTPDNSVVNNDEVKSMSDNLGEGKGDSNSLKEGSEDVKDNKSSAHKNENANCVSLPFIIGKKLGMS